MEQETELAEIHFRKALASNKSDSMARYNFGAFLFNQGRFEDARKQMKVASDDLSYERRPQAFYILGLCQHRPETLVTSFTQTQESAAPETES